MREVRDSKDRQGAPFLWADLGAEDEATLDRLIVENAVERTTFDCKEEARLILSESGRRELQEAEAALQAASPLTIAINWIGALSRVAIAVVSFFLGIIVAFFFENVSPNFYCSKLPNAFVAILTPCERLQEGNLQ